MTIAPDYNQFPLSVHYPLSPHLLGYLAGMAAEQDPMLSDIRDNEVLDLPLNIEATLADRPDFQRGVKEALDFRKEMNHQLPPKELF